uniref:Uncharacterized protein n=1 Tax=Oryza barthii TaxID=65489 RepID=A0A0D3FTE7_9ORYZ
MAKRSLGMSTLNVQKWQQSPPTPPTDAPDTSAPSALASSAVTPTASVVCTDRRSHWRPRELLCIHHHRCSHRGDEGRDGEERRGIMEEDRTDMWIPRPGG